MIILDTDVLSEALRAKPDPTASAWLDAQPRGQLFTTSITRAEILYGVSVLPDGQRRRRLWRAALAIFDEDLADHVLSFDDAAADLYARIGAERRNAGRPISQFDCMIAAITRSHGARLVTRNVSDFDDCGIEVVDPWQA